MSLVIPASFVFAALKLPAIISGTTSRIGNQGWNWHIYYSSTSSAIYLLYAVMRGFICFKT